VDVIYSVEEIPERNEKISAPGQQVSAGGPATNAAVAFAFLGGRAELVTAVGSHPVAAAIRDDLRQHKVRICDLARGRPELPPVSSIMVLRRTGERTVVSANAAVFSGLHGEFDQHLLRDAVTVLVDGHYMPLCISAARFARERSIPVVMDSGSWKDGMRDCCPWSTSRSAPTIIVRRDAATAKMYSSFCRREAYARSPSPAEHRPFA
jgi:sugar/nucleoside kinase (ribokinase family)